MTLNNSTEIRAAANNSSYAMRVSEVLQVQFPQASFVSVDTDVATQSRTAHSCDRYLQAVKTYLLLTDKLTINEYHPTTSLRLYQVQI